MTERHPGMTEHHRGVVERHRGMAEHHPGMAERYPGHCLSPRHHQSSGTEAGWVWLPIRVGEPYPRPS